MQPLRFSASYLSMPTMPHRRFVDAEGVEWEVYDVHALPGFGRPGRPQLAAENGMVMLPERWLTFESVSEKRRLAPIPEGWEDAPVDGLQRLLALAIKAKSP